MNTRFLETFVTVANLGSFRAAAEQLNISQATVSSRISALETELGVNLFDREFHATRITVVGALILDKAQDILAAERKLLTTLSDPATAAGRVRLGLVTSIVHTWLCDLMEEVARCYPRLEMELTIEPTTNIAATFDRGGLDMLLTTQEQQDEQTACMELPPLAMGWFGPAGMRDESLTLADVITGPLITFTRNSRPHANVLALFEEQGLRPSMVHCVTSISAIARLTERGLGIATLPRGCDLAGPDLCELQVDATLPDLPLYCVWRRNSDAAIYRAIADLARTCAEAHRAASGSDLKSM
ncbi:LysR family transcriptional regulator [Paracoccus seriniphilus]|uniref:Transcriptional regulator, LysR family n=1 Tax=Paracoccus seriniphilus TaxID=184748 RepID=A0A239PUF5_9RHOB|nr:LysR family transcriptional regulator [Paracoccus seriniphilus]WCR16545.1 LysR family transcriptional regulator [Paracoccus seriniphilus]SNT73758.1 transcriptional regulator, LysR family [Paracoccus seriniphilus]